MSDEPKCEACGDRPAPVPAGDNGVEQVYVCESCAAAMRAFADAQAAEDSA